MHLGVDWRVSADQTGHTTAAMQKHYSHGTPESRRQAAATLQAGLDAVGTQPDDGRLVPPITQPGPLTI